MGLLLALLPLWLVGSGVFALWYYFKKEKAVAEIEQARFSQAVSSTFLAEDLRKIISIIGERNSSSNEGRKNLSRMAVMIEGTLGPGNTGFQVKKIDGPADWPILQVTITGLEPKKPAVWAITTYDSPAGSTGAEANATGVAASLAAAQALAGEQFSCSVHLLFMPHFNEVESPAVATAAKVMELIRAPSPPRAVLCVEAMGLGETLWVTSRDTMAIPLEKVEGLGKVVGAEVACLADDADLASVLFEMDLPAVRVSTGPMPHSAVSAGKLPFSPTVAASAGRLVELIRRCAR